MLVLPLRSAALDAQVLAPAEKALVAALANSGAYEVLALSELEGMVEQPVVGAAAACDNSACASQLAGELGAPFALLGSLEALAGRWQLSLTLVDAQALRAKARSQVTSPPEEALLVSAIAVAVTRLLAPTASEPAAWTAPPTTRGATGVAATANAGGTESTPTGGPVAATGATWTSGAQGATGAAAARAATGARGTDATAAAEAALAGPFKPRLAILVNERPCDQGVPESFRTALSSEVADTFAVVRPTEDKPKSREAALVAARA